MKIKNLQRAAEIQEQLPALEEARLALSECSKAIVTVAGIRLPQSVNYNVLAVINAEINRLKDEVSSL